MQVLTMTLLVLMAPGSFAGEAEERVREQQSARLEVAASYFERGLLNSALDEVNLLLEKLPDLPGALNLRGLIHAAMARPALADSSFRRALTVAPADGDARHNYGWFLCQQQRFEDAEAQFAAALKLPHHGSIARTLLAQGVCQARAGQLARASESLTRAYELNPLNLTVAYNLAEVLYNLREFDRARFYVRRINRRRETANAQSLWLAVRIESRRQNQDMVLRLGEELRQRFPQSVEALRYETGRFDD